MLQRVQLLLVLCLFPLSVLRLAGAHEPLRSTGNGPLMGRGPPKGSKGPKEKPGDHILTKMTHMEKIFNFCDLYGVKQAKESYGSDFLAFDKKSKQACGRLRCTGNNHICCPVSGRFNGTAHTDYFCLTNTEEHRGSCPTEMTHITHLEYGTAKKLSENRARITCRRDTECRLNEKCCMKPETNYHAWPSYEPRAHDMVPSSSIMCRPAVDIEDTSSGEFQMWNQIDKEMPIRKIMKKMLSFLD